MALLFPGQTLVSPHYTLPGVIVQQSQQSGAWSLLKGGAPLVQLSNTDLAVKCNRVDLSTLIGDSQGGFNDLPSVNIVGSFASVPTYWQRVRAIFTRRESEMAGTYNTSGLELYNLAMRQAHFRLACDSLLYGVAPETGEGIINSPGVYETNFPADSNGNTLRTMAPGHITQTLNYILTDIVTRTNQLGKAPRIAILSTQRVIGLLQSLIVPLTTWQDAGAGSNSVAGVVTKSLKSIVQSVSWLPDDTLQGKGEGGSDLIIASIPEIELRSLGLTPDTNAFGDEISSQENACSLQLWNTSAPVEYPVPVPGGDLDIVSELKKTPGWVLRPETVTKISVWVDSPPSTGGGN